MGRKLATDNTRLFTHQVQTRVTETVYNRLNGFVGTSDCHSVSEVARRILSKERIHCFHHDQTIDPVIDELILVRRELNAIGHNINQVTHYFHMADTATQRTFHALKIADQYNTVGSRVTQLNELISGISKKWLQK
jgi:hypothetical protein